MNRLFVALALPEDVRRRLEMLRGGLRPAGRARADAPHAPLHRRGRRRAFAEIGDALARIEAEAFSLTLGGVGHFPPRGRVRILWAGVAPNPALMRLRERTEAAITASGSSRRPQLRAARDLARFASRVPAHRLQEFVSYHGPFSSGPFEVRSFELFSSHLGAAAHTTRWKRATAGGCGKSSPGVPRLIRFPRSVPCHRPRGRSGGRSRGSVHVGPRPPSCCRSRPIVEQRPAVEKIMSTSSRMS